MVGAFALPGERERVLLAALLPDANRAVPVSRLVVALWGRGPPATVGLKWATGGISGTKSTEVTTAERFGYAGWTFGKADRP